MIIAVGKIIHVRNIELPKMSLLFSEKLCPLQNKTYLDIVVGFTERENIMSIERYSCYTDFIMNNYYPFKSPEEQDEIRTDLNSYFESNDKNGVMEKLPPLKKAYGSVQGPEYLAKELKKEEDKEVQKRVAFLVAAFDIHDFLYRFLDKNGKLSSEENLNEIFKTYADEWDIPLKYFIVYYLDNAGTNSSKEFLNNVWANKYWASYAELLKEDFDNLIEALDLVSPAYASFALTHLWKKLPEQMLPKMIEFAGATQKSLNEMAQKLLKKYSGDPQNLLPLISLKRAKSREFGVQLLMEKWSNDEAVKSALTEHYSKEKNSAVKSLMETLFTKENWELPEGKAKKKSAKIKESAELSPQEYFLKKAKKYQPKEEGKCPVKKALALYNIPEKSPLRWSDGAEAPIEISYYLLVTAEKGDGTATPPETEELIAALNSESVAVWISELFYEWEVSSKGAWFIHLVAKYGDASATEPFIQKLITFYSNTRGRRYETLDTLLYLPKNCRDGLSAYTRKIAEILYKEVFDSYGDGVTVTGQWDRIYEPLQMMLADNAKRLDRDLNTLLDSYHNGELFDSEGLSREEFDYGSRQFRLQLSGESLTIVDDKGKKLKKMPPAGKSDDSAKVKAAKEQHKLFTKAIKVEQEFVKKRLYAKLQTFHTLPLDQWQEIYCDNPINFQMAQSVVWGVYESEGTLIHSFQLLDDKSFSTCDDEEYTIPEKSLISLLHPSDISAEERELWKERFEDYEITPVINQLDRTLVDVENLDWTKEFQGHVFTNPGKSFLKRDYIWGGTTDGGGMVSLYKCFTPTTSYYRGEEHIEIVFNGDISGVFSSGKIPIETVKIKNESRDRRYLSELYHELKQCCSEGLGYDPNWKKLGW